MVKKIDTSRAVQPIESFKESSDSECLILIDTQNEFIDNFWIMIDFYKKFIQWNKQYFKRTVLSLHMTLQSLFILFLNSISTYTSVRETCISKSNTPKQNINIVNKQKAWFKNQDLEKERQKLLNLLEKLKRQNITDNEKSEIRDIIFENQVLSIVNRQSRIAKFETLWERVKNTTNWMYWITINLPKDDIIKKRNKSISVLNNTRNDFIHFEPKLKINQISHSFDIGRVNLDIIEHILSKCKKNNDPIWVNVSAFFLHDIDVKNLMKAISEIKDIK